MGRSKSNTLGTNTRSRRTTKAERKAFAEVNAPAVIPEPSNKCLLCQEDTILTKPYGYMRLCDDCIAAVCWQEVQNYIDGRIVKAGLFCDAWDYFEKNRKLISDVMHPDFWRSYVRQAFFKYFDDWLELELFFAENMSNAMLSMKKERGWDGFARAYLAVRGIDAQHLPVHWLGSDLAHFGRYRCSTVLVTAEKREKEWKAPEISEAYVNELNMLSKPRSNEEVIEEVFQKKMAGKGLTRLDELYEAVEKAVKSWFTEPQARVLFDGYRLHISPGIPKGCHPPRLPKPNERWQYIKLSHPKTDKFRVVGMKEQSVEMPELVAKRSDIKWFMSEVANPTLLHSTQQGQNKALPKSRSNGKAKKQNTLKPPSRASKQVAEVTT